MTTRSVKAAKATPKAAAKATPKAAAKAATSVVALATAKVPERAKKAMSPLQRAAYIKRLVDPKCDAANRRLLLSALTLGDVAAISGMLGKAVSSAYEVMAVKIAGLHGNNWVALVKALPADLSDAQKTQRKAIIKTLEGIRETVKANSGGNADKARDALRAVKEWGEGKRQARQPKSNAKAPLHDFLKSWDCLPSLYRRVMKDEGADPIDMELGDAIAAWFTKRSINPRAVLDCSGKQGWNC